MHPQDISKILNTNLLFFQSLEHEHEDCMSSSDTRFPHLHHHHLCQIKPSLSSHDFTDHKIKSSQLHNIH